MLDAILPTTTYATTNGNGSFGYTAGVTKNAYRDTSAKSVGYAYLNGIVGKFDGVFWKPIGDTSKVLSGDFVTQISVTDAGGVSGNGLLYTGTNAPFNITYYPSHFGVTNWSVAECNDLNPIGNTTNVCESRKMILPTTQETSLPYSSYLATYSPCSGGSGNVGGAGVPSHPSGWTLTTSAHKSSTIHWVVWSGTSTVYWDYDINANNRYVRCVR